MDLNGRQCFGGEIGLLRVSRFVLVFEMGFEWVVVSGKKLARLSGTIVGITFLEIGVNFYLIE